MPDHENELGAGTGAKFFRDPENGQLMFVYGIDANSRIGPRPALAADQAEHVGAWQTFEAGEAMAPARVGLKGHAPTIVYTPVGDGISEVSDRPPPDDELAEPRNGPLPVFDGAPASPSKPIAEAAEAGQDRPEKGPSAADDPADDRTGRVRRDRPTKAGRGRNVDRPAGAPAHGPGKPRGEKPRP